MVKYPELRLSETHAAGRSLGKASRAARIRLDAFQAFKRLPDRAPDRKNSSCQLAAVTN